MNYELAKKLKDAGFPQRDPNGIKPFPNYTGYGCGFVYPLDDGQEQCYSPTLSELIEAVRNHPMNRKDVGLYTLKGGYNAWARKTYFEVGNDGERNCFGLTPEEAVANLWLVLNKK